MDLRWHIYPTAAALAERTAAAITRLAAEAIAERGAFHLVLAGGETPRAVYTLLREAESTWNAWHLYFGDERCLPADNAARNDRMAAAAWLDRVPIPPAQVHRIPAELGPEAGAASYAPIVDSVPQFDLVLLGLGEDGHTASLFPSCDCGAGTDAPPVLAVRDAPKPPPERVSLSAHRLAVTRALFMLVTGASKREALEALRRGADLPMQHVRPEGGVDLLVDAAAAPWDQERFHTRRPSSGAPLSQGLQ